MCCDYEYKDCFKICYGNADWDGCNVCDGDNACKKEGCTDKDATNYDPAAVISKNETCIY